MHVLKPIMGPRHVGEPTTTSSSRLAGQTKIPDPKVLLHGRLNYARAGRQSASTLSARCSGGILGSALEDEMPRQHSACWAISEQHTSQYAWWGHMQASLPQEPRSEDALLCKTGTVGAKLGEELPCQQLSHPRQ